MSFSAVRTLAQQRAAIATCTIFHIDSYLKTRLAIPRTDLETHRHTVTTVVDDSAGIDAVLEHLEAAKPEHGHTEAEYRWKLAFANAEGTRLLELYAHAFAPYGMIGDQPVAFADDSLQRWLQATYAPSELEPVG